MIRHNIVFAIERFFMTAAGFSPIDGMAARGIHAF